MQGWELAVKQYNFYWGICIVWMQQILGTVTFTISDHFTYSVFTPNTLLIVQQIIFSIWRSYLIGLKFTKHWFFFVYKSQKKKKTSHSQKDDDETITVPSEENDSDS